MDAQFDFPPPSFSAHGLGWFFEGWTPHPAGHSHCAQTRLVPTLLSQPRRDQRLKNRSVPSLESIDHVLCVSIDAAARSRLGRYYPTALMPGDFGAPALYRTPATDARYQVFTGGRWGPTVPLPSPARHSSPSTTPLPFLPPPRLHRTRDSPPPLGRLPLCRHPAAKGCRAGRPQRPAPSRPAARGRARKRALPGAQDLSLATPAQALSLAPAPGLRPLSRRPAGDGRRDPPACI